MNYVFLVLKKFDKKCHFRSIFGSFPVKFPRIFFLENFHSTQRFVFEFQGEALQQFLSCRAHFRRYEHLRGFCSLLPDRPVAVKVKLITKYKFNMSEATSIWH